MRNSHGKNERMVALLDAARASAAKEPGSCGGQMEEAANALAALERMAARADTVAGADIAALIAPVRRSLTDTRHSSQPLQ